MKKKLTLDLADLRVDSFRTAPEASARGTVFGRDESDCYTYSCQGTCGASPPTDSTTPRAALDKPTRDDLTLCLPCCA